jgi:hypothetical protein
MLPVSSCTGIAVTALQVLVTLIITGDSSGYEIDEVCHELPEWIPIPGGTAGQTACGKPDLPQAGWFKNIRASEAMNAVGRGGD